MVVANAVCLLSSGATLIHFSERSLKYLCHQGTGGESTPSYKGASRDLQQSSPDVTNSATLACSIESRATRLGITKLAKTSSLPELIKQTILFAIGASVRRRPLLPLQD